MTKFFAPGRVNLLGEHIDYNGGCVLPCSLTVGTYADVGLRDDGLIRLSARGFAETLEIKPGGALRKTGAWTDYPAGIIAGLRERGCEIRGFDAVYYGDLPVGAGLSSSASVLLVTSVLINDLNNLNIDRVELVKLAKDAENGFVGVNCGIMDQFCVAMSKKDHCLHLNCKTLQYSHVPLELGKYSIVIANSKKKRGLSGSKYNERRAECGSALADIKKKFDVSELCDIEDFDTVRDVISDPKAKLRAEHAINENRRTYLAAEHLKNGDVAAFGRLMNESHSSLDKLFDVSCAELNALVSAAWDFEGCAGARMTGAGFGGCTVNLVETDLIPDFTSRVSKRYTKETGLAADFYTVKPGDGARRIM